MSLLNVLTKSLLSDVAVSALAKKTGLSSAKLKKLLPLAVPVLLKALTSNASSQSGIQSLLGALTQHTNTKSLPEQINEAQAQVIARDICNRIEKEMTYPGQIKVTIIRETRSVEYAK